MFLDGSKEGKLVKVGKIWNVSDPLDGGACSHIFYGVDSWIS
jgi:hypothetical protein